MPLVVGINVSRSAEDACDMMRVKRKVKPDQEKPKMPEAQSLVQHPAGGLGIPIVDRGKYHEEKAADQRIVEVRHDKIGVSQLPVEGRHTQHDTRQAGDEELKQERQATQHGQLEANLATVKCSQPVKDFDPGRHTLSLIHISEPTRLLSISYAV